MTARLLLGDCFEVLAQIEDASVDAIVTDPPYAIPTHVAAGRTITRNAGDLSTIEASFRSLFDQFARVLRPTGRLFVFADGSSYPVIFRAAYGRFQTALLVWDKGRVGMGREFRKTHELILHGWQDETPVVSDGVCRPDIIRQKPVGADRIHPAEKPVPLLQALLEVCGDSILDPFMGSGSAGVACARLGKQFVGIEIAPDYFAAAERRIRAAEENPWATR